MRLNLLQFCLLTGCISFTFPGSTYAQKNDSNASLLSSYKQEDQEFQNLANSVKPSIVVIESVDRVGREGGRGTGFVLSSDGLIATNFHVIGEHRDFNIRFSDGKTYRPTSIVALDRARDLALFKIDAEDLTPLRLGNSNNLIAGETILSVGNPLGYSFSVSRGVVAAIRELEFGDGHPMVQVAVPIEPGSSGSPVIDLDGKVIAILSIKSGGAMGFGVPVNALKSLLSEKSQPIAMDKWLTIGTLDRFQWKVMMGGTWKQRAGEIRALGLGNGFGGRMLCLNQTKSIQAPFEIEVEVKLEDDSGAAGLVFCSDKKDKHYGFYPTNGSLRLTRFDGPSIYNWNILKTVESNAYLPEKWNLLHVRFEENGRILCSINKQLVIDVIDLEKEGGFIGLCKFREPSASFRNFRFAKRFSSSQVKPKSVLKLRKITRNLSPHRALGESDLQQILDIGKTAPQMLQDYSEELKQRSDDLQKLSKEIRERLVIAELVESLSYPDEKSIDLLKSALLIARIDNEHFNLNDYLKKADALADQIKSEFPKHSNDEQRIKILVSQLFNEMGFHGSTLDFHHRSNSYMNEVMDDREGLPITLSILFIELADRLNLKVTGLGLPGHFLAMYRKPQALELDQENLDRNPAKYEIIIDAFGGKIIDRKEAARLTGLAIEDLAFEPSPKKEIIKRMLRNLVQVAGREKDPVSQTRYLDTILAISPEDRYSRAQRAMIYYIREEFERALSDIDHLLESDPESPENQPLRVIRNRLINQGAAAF
jgi:serine protease Do